MNRSLAIAAAALTCAMLAGCESGSGAIRIPVLEGAFADDPAEWAKLSPRDRYRRGWEHFEGGEATARSGANREDARLLSAGGDQAAEGLEACAATVAAPADRDAIQAVAKRFRVLADSARFGRMSRSSRAISDIVSDARRFAPGRVELVEPPASSSAPTPATLEPAPAKAAPGEWPEGVVLKKRVEVRAGPSGEAIRHALAVLKPDGTEVEVEVTADIWQAAHVGKPLPPRPSSEGTR